MKGTLFALLATAIPPCTGLVIRHEPATDLNAAIVPHLELRAVPDSNDGPKTFVSTVMVTRIICNQQPPTPQPLTMLEQKEPIVEEATPQPPPVATSDAPIPPPAAPTTAQPVEPPVSTNDPPSAPPAAPTSALPGPPPANPPSGSVPGPEDTNTVHTGELTYYDTGLGACGVTSSNDQDVVAVSHELYDAYTPGSDPNQNTLCGRKIKIMYPQGNGQMKERVVVVVDRCTGCKPTDLDIPPPMHRDLVPNSEHIGRAAGMQWKWLPA